MALRATLEGAVDTAFAALQDLVVDVTLSQSEASSYDFATGQTVTTPTATSIVQGVLFTEEKRSQDGIRATNTLIVRSADLPSPDIYDSFTVGSKTYSMTSYSDNGFTIELQLSGATNG